MNTPRQTKDHGGSHPREQGGAHPRDLLGGYAALVFVQLCFGLFAVFGKMAFEGFTPRAVAGWRFLFGALALGTIAFARHGRAMWPQRGDWLRLQLCSLLGVVLNMVIFMEGLSRTSAVNAGLFMPVIPIWTFAIAVCVGQERFRWSRGLGMALAFGGTSLLLFKDGVDLSSDYFVGNLCFAANTFCYSLFLVVSKPLLKRISALSLIAWVFILSVWTVPLFAWGEDFIPATASNGAWLSLGYTLLFPTVIAYLLNTFALARVPASTNAAFIFLQPLVAVVGGVLLLSETFPPGSGIAAVVILAGVWLVIRQRGESKDDSRDGRS